jgi:transposase
LRISLILDYRSGKSFYSLVEAKRRAARMLRKKSFVTRMTAENVPAGHPLVTIREILNRALRDMHALFESIYEERGRYSVAPEWLLRGLVLQALYGISSERLLCNMLYRWFVGLSMDDAPCGHSTYTKTAIRLIEHEVVRSPFERGMQQAKTRSCSPTSISASTAR